uniref:Galectin n=1 Tax=Astyanax mexicanus TaxID=7994 RepID=A0A8B9JCI0_ASTMX
GCSKTFDRLCSSKLPTAKCFIKNIYAFICYSFEINLKTGQSSADDVAFHFKLLMAMNSFRKGKWESEESASVGPFTKGAVFTVFFVVTTQGYEVQCLKHRYFNIALRFLSVFKKIHLCSHRNTIQLENAMIYKPAQ